MKKMVSTIIFHWKPLAKHIAGAVGLHRVTGSSANWEGEAGSPHELVWGAPFITLLRVTQH